MSYTPSFYLARFAEFDITPPSLDAARALLDQPVSLPGFTERTARLREQLAADLAAGTITDGPDLDARLAAIDARAGVTYGLAVARATELRAEQALDLLRGDRKTIGRRVTELENEARAEMAAAVQALVARNIQSSAEAMQAGREMAGQWATRDEARARLGRLADLRGQLAAVGLCDATAGPIARTAARVKAALSPAQPEQPAPGTGQRAGSVS